MHENLILIEKLLCSNEKEETLTATVEGCVQNLDEIWQYLFFSLAIKENVQVKEKFSIILRSQSKNIQLEILEFLNNRDHSFFEDILNKNPLLSVELALEFFKKGIVSKEQLKNLLTHSITTDELLTRAISASGGMKAEVSYMFSNGKFLFLHYKKNDISQDIFEIVWDSLQKRLIAFIPVFRAQPWFDQHILPIPSNVSVELIVDYEISLNEDTALGKFLNARAGAKTIIEHDIERNSISKKNRENNIEEIRKQMGSIENDDFDVTHFFSNVCKLLESYYNKKDPGSRDIFGEDYGEAIRLVRNLNQHHSLEYTDPLNIVKRVISKEWLNDTEYLEVIPSELNLVLSRFGLPEIPKSAGKIKKKIFKELTKGYFETSNDKVVREIHLLLLDNHGDSFVYYEDELREIYSGQRQLISEKIKETSILLRGNKDAQDISAINEKIIFLKNKLQESSDDNIPAPRICMKFEIIGSYLFLVVVRDGFDKEVRIPVISFPVA